MQIHNYTDWRIAENAQASYASARWLPLDDDDDGASEPNYARVMNMETMRWQFDI